MRALSFVPCAAAIGGLALMVPACGEQPRPDQAAVPPAVTVERVVAEDVRSTSSFTGRIEAMDKVDLRARVEGFLEKRLFTEGADVKEGDLLFVIEKGLYQAAVDEARPASKRRKRRSSSPTSRSNAKRSWSARTSRHRRSSTRSPPSRARRTAPCWPQKAALEKAELQLGYTEIRAPIAGRIGRAPISVGNFVTAVEQSARHHRQPGSDLRQLPGDAARDPGGPQAAGRIGRYPAETAISCSSPTAAAMPSRARSTSST